MGAATLRRIVNAAAEEADAAAEMRAAAKLLRSSGETGEPESRLVRAILKLGELMRSGSGGGSGGW